MPSIYLVDPFALLNQAFLISYVEHMRSREALSKNFQARHTTSIQISAQAWISFGAQE